ncbi:MAG: putative 2OG-Fe(II) oxygenase [Myxococcota bacterium]|nr:putative 2OG-Fe(II) oxygenase [Myxococcota bacterium]
MDHGILRPFAGDVYHLAPIPIFYRVLDRPDLGEFHAALMTAATAAMEQRLLEVPDEKHAEDLGHAPPDWHPHSFTEAHPPAVGIWHCVPTNQFLDLEADAVRQLRRSIEDAFVETVRVTSGSRVSATLTESWIQLYRNGDRKVLHNHERYDPPPFEHMWAGAYYVDDGAPVENMKYSGLFSFRIRGENHFIRPKPGLLMMWPADLLHEVHPFYGERERVVINFNLHGPARQGPLRKLIDRLRR